MKRLIFISGFVFILSNYSCNKISPYIKRGVVIASLCETIQTVVQLNYHDPLSYNWKDADGKIYQNVVVVYNKNLQNSLGKSFTFSRVRPANNSDPYIVILGICVDYNNLFLILDNVVFKN